MQFKAGIIRCKRNEMVLDVEILWNKKKYENTTPVRIFKKEGI
jgi:hypothetical protein